MTPAAEELLAAVRDEASLDEWLRSRGFALVEPAPAPPVKASLRAARHYFAPQNAKAPPLLVLYHPTWRSRAIVGRDLRIRQRDANEYRTLLRAEGLEREAPALCLVACPEFMLVFELDGDPYSRRLRFAAGRLDRPGTPLEQHFLRFRASTMESWARESSEASDAWLDEIVSGDGVRWDFGQLFVGSRLDDPFVEFMDYERGRIGALLLAEENRKHLLKEVWAKLRAGFNGSNYNKSPTPSLERIALDRRMRSGLVATVDTVLLRIVLYRYLEAQFGYRMDDAESREIALGSYDDVLEQTVRLDREGLQQARGKKSKKGAAPAAQLSLFAKVDQPDVFVREIRERADWYQKEAGGDLHHGAVAEAANVLQEFLLEHHKDTFAELLAGTSTDEYSFHYADLDPKAFQQFYEGTIGTDLRVSYDPASGAATIGVAPFHRNRKEQGAYYTDEGLCSWLVERTLGRTYDEWEQRFLEFVESRGRTAKGRLPAVRGLLDELLGWRILDPTCGGGIFLRAAFELLAQKRPRIVGLLSRLPEEVRRTCASEQPYSMFSEAAEPGDWEWHILLRMLYGVDIDVKAINVASNLLTLSALTYKRSGVCFPSFIHTSLKPGNALLNPLPSDERARFASTYGAELARIMDMRDGLRDAKIDRERWKELHGDVRLATASIVQREATRRYSDVFGDGAEGALFERVRRVGLFLYEAEYPEVFFRVEGRGRSRRAVPRENPGFDVVIGNPPWEEPAAEYKQFLPEFDPEYLELKGAASERREQELLADPEICRRWEDYRASVEDYKSLLTAGWYEHQRRAVRGRIPGAHTNLYKYATEMAWKLVRSDGRCGLALDGGLWSDLAASGLRRLLLEDGADVQVCGFTNNAGLFPDVHRSYKFSATSFRKGGVSASMRAIFMQRDFDALASFDNLAVAIAIADIRDDSRDSYPVPEIRSLEHYRASRALVAHPALVEEPWSIETYSRELNAGEQRGYFLDRAKGFLPLLQGRHFGLFGVFEGKLPEQWVDPGLSGAGGFLRGKQEKRILDAIAIYLESGGRMKGAKRKAALNWVEAVTGERDLPASWIRLDWEGYRLAWRTEARNDDRRTLIAAIVPRRVALTDKAPYVKPFRIDVTDHGVSWALQYEYPQLLYLAGMLSSIPCDSIARTRLAKKDFKKNMFEALHVPEWRGDKEQLRVAELCALLTCLPATHARPWADYAELGESLGISTDAGLRDPQERRQAEVELNVIAASLYGLGRAEFAFLVDTLFMTPKYRDEHALVRDEVCAAM